MTLKIGDPVFTIDINEFDITIIYSRVYKITNDFISLDYNPDIQYKYENIFIDIKTLKENFKLILENINKFYTGQKIFYIYKKNIISGVIKEVSNNEVTLKNKKKLNKNEVFKFFNQAGDFLLNKKRSFEKCFEILNDINLNEEIFYFIPIQDQLNNIKNLSLLNYIKNTKISHVNIQYFNSINIVGENYQFISIENINKNRQETIKKFKEYIIKMRVDLITQLEYLNILLETNYKIG